MQSSGHSIARLVTAVVLAAALGALTGHFAGAAIVQLWLRPAGGLPAPEVAAAPFVFTIVGCLLGTFVGMGWAAYVSAMRAIRMGHADPDLETDWQRHDEADFG
jgi:hypothetical protein